MKITARCQVFGLAFLLFAGTAVTHAETLVISGTGAGIATMQTMADAFQKKHPDVTVTVLPSIGSGGGIKAVAAGKLNIGLSTRPLNAKERDPNIVTKVYGRTAFVFAVQNSNPVNNVTLAEIEAMYARRRTTWPHGTLIRLVLRPLSDTFSEFLANISPAIRSAAEQAHAIPGVFVGNTDQEAAAQIEKTMGSFGVTSMALILSEKREIKALSVEGTAPTIDNVSSGKYPYTMSLHLVYRKDHYKGATMDFIEFVFSEDGRKILHDSGHATPQRTVEEQGNS